MDESWWKTAIDVFNLLFTRKNKDLWKMLWDKVGARAWANGYIKAHLKFNLPGERPTLKDIKELRYPDAKKYFDKHGLEFVTQMTETDRNQLHSDLVEGWGLGPKAFARKYKQNYSFSPTRLTNIYRTEVHLGQTHAQMEGAVKAGMLYKTWYAMGDEARCPICGKLNGEKKPINQPYSNGEMVAHAHPRCRCVDLYTKE